MVGALGLRQVTSTSLQHSSESGCQAVKKLKQPRGGTHGGSSAWSTSQMSSQHTASNKRSPMCKWHPQTESGHPS